MHKPILVKEWYDYIKILIQIPCSIFYDNLVLFNNSKQKSQHSFFSEIQSKRIIFNNYNEFISSFYLSMPSAFYHTEASQA